jgi:signal transduction histidine kinase
MIGRLPLRLRLSLLYGAMVFVVGAALMAVAYVIVERNLSVYSHRVSTARPTGRLATLSLPPKRAEALADLQAFLERQSRRQAVIEHRARIDAQDHVAGEFLLALIALTLPSAALGYLVAGRALRPVAAITDAARRVADGDLSERIAFTGPRDELRRLADTFDAMLERLDDAFARQQAFVANASHELKTPLAIVRAELDATLSDPLSREDELRAMAAAIDEATARSEQLIERLLLLARSERAALIPQAVDLERTVHRVLDDLAAEADEKALEVTLSLAPAVAWGDEVLLTSLVRNVIENAIRHNTPHGSVEIATGERADVAVFTVENDGEPIPAARVGRLFEPFRRLDRTATPSRGSGLGLAISNAVAVAHAGTLTAHARASGGLAVRAELPLPADRGDRLASDATQPAGARAAIAPAGLPPMAAITPSLRMRRGSSTTDTAGSADSHPASPPTPPGDPAR